MKRKQPQGPNLKTIQINCLTKDNIKVRVTCTCDTFIIHNRRYNAYTSPKDTYTVGWRDKLQRQIEAAISYVLKHYKRMIINSHMDHINRQVKNCLNENYLEETESLSDRGLAIKTIELIKVDEKSGLY